jgi:N-acetylmuramic acid 6-phosphate etherase
MRIANSKLRDRAVRICVTATGCSEPDAQAALLDARDDIALAIVMLARDADPAAARALLDAAGGNLRDALGQSG